MDRYRELAERLVAMIAGADAPNDRETLSHKAAEMLRHTFAEWVEDDTATLI